MRKWVIYTLIVLLIASCSSADSGITRLGNYKNRPRGFQSVYMPGGQIALYVPNTLNVPAKIINARFFLGKKGNYKKPFGVKLFELDSVTGKPGRNLLAGSLIIDNIKKSGWHNVDLALYNLDFPKNGVFVSMEWIPDENFNEVSQSECQYLAYSKIKDKNNAWYCALGINWYQLPSVDLNAMISIDVRK